MIFERTVKEIRGDYAVLVGESGVETEVALALLPDGVREGIDVYKRQPMMYTKSHCAQPRRFISDLEMGKNSAMTGLQSIYYSLL